MSQNFPVLVRHLRQVLAINSPMLEGVERMRLKLGWFAVMAGLIAILEPNVCLAKQGDRIALVIGNGDYKSSPLANPVVDANDMAAALEKCRFSVMKRTNANRKEMRQVIRDFGNRIKGGGTGLFYYAGHGIQVNGVNYLVPVGAEVFSEDEVEDECLKVSSVLRKMEAAGNDLNVIILDACRNNPFGRSFRSGNKGLAKMDAPTGSILAYATAPGSVAADGSDKNGLYTSRLLKQMLTPGLKIEELFKKVRADVMITSARKQVPWESSSLVGDFYFIPERGISVVKRPEAEPHQTAVSGWSLPLGGNNAGECTVAKPQLSPKEYLEKAKKTRSKGKRIEYLLAAIDGSPDLFDAYLELGQTYANDRQFQEAIDVYERALAVQESQMVHYEVGRLSWILGKSDLAKKHLRVAAHKQNYLGKQAVRLLERIERVEGTQ